MCQVFCGFPCSLLMDTLSGLSTGRRSMCPAALDLLIITISATNGVAGQRRWKADDAFPVSSLARTSTSVSNWLWLEILLPEVGLLKILYTI